MGTSGVDQFNGVEQAQKKVYNKCVAYKYIESRRGAAFCIAKTIKISHTNINQTGLYVYMIK
jgi:hypothetical protein